MPTCFRVHGLVGLEVVQGAAGAPGPGTQGAPIVQLAGWPRLSRPMMPSVRPAPLSAWTLVGVSVAQPNPSPEPAVANWVRLRLAVPCPGEAPPRPAAAGEAQFHDYGTGPGALAGVVNASWISTVIWG